MRYSKPYWMNVIDSKPARIVTVFNTGNWQGNPIGFENFMALMAAVRAAAESKDSCVRWQRLVDAGITGALCKCVIEHSSDLKANYSDDNNPSSYFAPFLELLVLGLPNVKRSPVTTRTLFVESLIENWSQIVLRLTTRPHHMFKPHENYASERMFIPELLINMREIDPTCVSVVDSPNDLTVSLVTRCLMHSVGIIEFCKCVRALAWLADPPEAIFHNRRPKGFIARMQQGIPDQSFASLFMHYTGKFPFLNTTYINHCMHLVWALINCALWSCPSDRDFLHDLFGHTTMFSILFRLLSSSEHELKQANFDPDLDRLILPILMLMKRCTESAIDVESNEGENLMRTWLCEGVFDVLEAVWIQHGGIVHGVCTWVGAIFGDIFMIVRFNPSLLSPVRRDFPRPRLLRACLDIAFLHKDTVSRETDVIIPRNITSMDEMWIIVDFLERVSSIDRQCSRRGCRNRHIGRCRACKDVGYCGHDCQSRDWPEHRLRCGFIGIVPSGTVEHSHGIPLPQKFPFRLEKVLPLSSLIVSEPTDEATDARV